ncbi:MAG: hypothetical protein QM676_13050 [Novosphingobium sp.]
MTKRLTAIIAITGMSALAGCGTKSVDVDACVNPRLLRVKVAQTIFDLPNTVTSAHPITMDLERTDEKLGIVSLNYAARNSDPANRSDCNRKGQPVADFGYDMGLVYQGDGTEPAEYRLGNKMHALLDIAKYDPQRKGSWRSEYLADVADIEHVRFVERIEIPPIGNHRMGQAIYKFAYKGREIEMKCQVWDDSKVDGRKNDARPAYPNQCVPAMPFRAGDIIIGVNQRSHAGGRGAKARLIPPEEWPKQWAYTINKILSFRVDPRPYGND